MRIKISGMSGFLGTLISSQLIAWGYQTEPIPRSLLMGDVQLLKNYIEGTDIIIHLSGSPVLARWTEKKQKEIYESRVITTNNLVNAIRLLNPDKRPAKFIQASAIGIYKAGIVHNETSTDYETGFLGKVVNGWENASMTLPENVHRIVFRIGLVIGRNAKTITNLLLPFKLGLGATIGSGKQAFPFVHEKDVVNAFVWAVENLNSNEVINLVAPQQISNGDFTKELAKILNRPAIFVIPAFVLKMILGEAAVLLTEIPKVIPSKLIEKGFKFQFPEISQALNNIITRK